MFEALTEAFSLITGHGWLELPADYGEVAYALCKSANHKYIKRVPKAGGGYRYFYKVGHGGGVHDEEHMVVGAAFKHEGGHWHITDTRKDTDGAGKPSWGSDGLGHGDLVIRHDETGETRTVKKSHLSSMLAEHHAPALAEHKAKIMADWSAAHANGASDKQKAKIRARAESAGIGSTKLKMAAESATPAKKETAPAEGATSSRKPKADLDAAEDHRNRSLDHHGAWESAQNRVAPKRVVDAHLAAYKAHAKAQRAHEDGAADAGELSIAADAATASATAATAAQAALKADTLTKEQRIAAESHNTKLKADASRAKALDADKAKRLGLGATEPANPGTPAATRERGYSATRHDHLAAHENAEAWHKLAAHTADDKHEDDYGKTAKREHEDAARAHRDAAEEWKSEIKGGMAVLEHGTLASSAKAWRQTGDAKARKAPAADARRTDPAEEVRASRRATLAAVERSIEQLGIKRPVGISAVHALQVKRNPTKQEKALLVQHRLASKNVNAPTPWDHAPAPHGVEFDYGSKSERGASKGGSFSALTDAMALLSAPGILWLPRAYGETAYALAKGIGHAYIKRVPTGKVTKTGKVRYRYYYHAGHGGGVDAHEHMVEGASFKHDGGHWKITSTKGGKLTIVHDETGESKQISKAELGAMLREKHGVEKRPRKPKADPVAAATRSVRAEPRDRAPVPKKPERPKGHGSNTVVFFADKGGQARDHAARWKVVEADSVHASHIAGSGFKKNPAYPEGVQERVYHSDKSEQAKVLGNADRFRPEIVHNTNPDAVNGAPLVTEDGVVLGGNSRTMTMQHLYATDRGHKVKDHLVSEAHQFGLDPKEIAGMKNPILVRELTGIRADGTGKDELKGLVRQANESFTQGMDPRADQVARAVKLSDGAITALAGSLGDDETVAEFLAKPSGAAKHFVAQLRASGAIDSRNEAQYLRANGTLNEDGRNYVTKLMVGKLVPDPQLLSDIPSSTMTALAKAAPYILGAKATGHEHDVTGDLRSALHAMVEMDIHGSSSLDNHLNQSTIKIDGQSLIGELDVAKNPRARLMYDVLQKNKGPNQLSSVFREYANMAKRYPEGQEDLFGQKTTAGDVLTRAAKGVRKGSVFVGPKGGRYSDAAHKHSWTPDDKGGQQADFGAETDAAKKARNEKVAKALTAWKVAATAHHQDKGNRGAYQGHYDALHKLGKALGLGTGEDAVDGAKRWLRAKGYRPEMHKGDTAKTPVQQHLFRGTSRAPALTKGPFAALARAVGWLTAA